MLIPWTILYTVCKDVGYKKGDTFPAFMVLGIGVAAQMGFTALPIKSHSLLSLGILESVTHGEYSINFFEYAAINIPITLVVLIIYILMMRFVFKVNVDLLYEITEEKFSSLPQSEADAPGKNRFPLHHILYLHHGASEHHAAGMADYFHSA